MIPVLFWMALFLFIYPLSIYPVLIAFLGQIAPRPINKGRDTGALPTVTFIIPAYNEESIIEEKIRNTLSLDYPTDCLEILLVSDGSTDGTVVRAAAIRDPRIRILDCTNRRGKLLALEDAVCESHGEVVAFSDASALLSSDALRKTVMNFNDPTVGCVSGRYVISNITTPLFDARSLGERRYFEFEVLQRRFESQFDSTLGAHGAFYAIRRSLYPVRPPGVINDDFVIPMLIVEKGFRTVYESSALVFERHQTNVRGEFRRRVRISHGNFQQIWILRHLLGLSRPRVSFVFWSHKVIRAFQPLYLSVILLAPFAIGGKIYVGFSLLQALFYLLGILGMLQKKGRRVLALPLYFTMGNTAIVAGLIRTLRGKARPVVQWEKS